MRSNRNNSTGQRPLISVSQAAALLGIGVTAAYRWLERGELPGAVHVGGRWWVRRHVLEAWLSGKGQATSTSAT